MVLSFPLANQQPVMMKLQQTFAFLRYTLRAIYSPSELLKSARPPWFESGRQQGKFLILTKIVAIAKYPGVNISHKN